MKGNARIAEILQKEYGIKDLTGFEEIKYEIQHFTDDISRVKIMSTSKRDFCCPVYAIFDGYHMSWYGDYGSFVFDCTWKTNVMNVAYDSPYYQLEKLDVPKRYQFNEQKCGKKLLELIKEGDWYNSDLNEEQKKRFDVFIATSYDSIWDDDVLYEHEEVCGAIKKLYQATGDEYEWVSEIRNTDLEEEDFYNIFGCADYEIYDIGNKAPLRFFIILYLLSVVANMESEDTE
jgi:hypothetical protein